MNIDIREMTQDGFFVKWPHESLPKVDAHLRLAALIGVQPDTFSKQDGAFIAEYSSIRPGVERVITRSSGSRWISTTVEREGEEDLVWTVAEDVLHTARWWQGIEGEPRWALVVDHDFVNSLGAA